MIWKFPCISTGPMEIDVPDPGFIRHVGRDPATGLMAFWAEVNPGPLKTRVFQIVATGQQIASSGMYRGTAILETQVFHLFELDPADHPRLAVR